MNIAAQSLLQELKAVEFFLLLSAQLLQPWFWQLGSEERAANVFPFQRKTCKSQIADTEHILKFVLFIQFHLQFQNLRAHYFDTLQLSCLPETCNFYISLSSALNAPMLWGCL